MISLALPSDTFERVDRTQAGLQVVAPELFDRPREVVGNPAFPIGLNLRLVPKLSRSGLLSRNLRLLQSSLGLAMVKPLLPDHEGDTDKRSDRNY
jgi:hypothetical protein